MLAGAIEKARVKLPAPAKNAILFAFPSAMKPPPCRDEDGKPEADPELRDTESVPLAAGEDPVDAA